MTAEHLPHLLVLLALLVPVAPRAWRAARTAPPGRAGQLLVAAACLGAGGGHLVAAKDHAGGQVGFFLAAGVLQVAVAPLVLRRPSRPVAATAALVSAGLVALWWESRVVGLHYGREPVGVCDVVVVTLELLVLAGCRRLHGASPLRLDGELAGWGLIVLAGSMAAAA